MSAMTDIWTKEDFAEYERQCKLINDAYGHGIPETSVQRIAADIVNKQKQMNI